MTGRIKVIACISDKPKPPDTFIEKFATQIVRNVQITIKDIHIRYEDRVSKAKGSFALGITLHNLSVNTTDQNWLSAISQDATAMIYKVKCLQDVVCGRLI